MRGINNFNNDKPNRYARYDGRNDEEGDKTDAGKLTRAGNVTVYSADRNENAEDSNVV